jgi:hypothetical protein
MRRNEWPWGEPARTRPGGGAKRALSSAVHNPAVNTALRIALLVWILGYLLVSCGPLFGGHLILGGLAAIGGIIFFIPWAIGILVLLVLIWATNGPRRLP